MDKRYFLGLLLVLTLGTGHAQRGYAEKGSGPVILQRNHISLNLLMPGFQYELALARNFSVSTALGLGLGTPSEGYTISPVFDSKARYYTNLRRRRDMGKNVSGNSGDYIGVVYDHFFTKWEVFGNMDNGDSDLDFIGAVYGLQRTYKNGIAFSVNAGGGWYLRDGIDTGLAPFVGIGLGWSPRFGKATGGRN